MLHTRCDLVELLLRNLLVLQLMVTAYPSTVRLSLTGIKVILDSFETKHSVGEPSFCVQSNLFHRGLSIARFLRWSAVGRGAFVSIANLWGQFAVSGEEFQKARAATDSSLALRSP